MHAGARRAAEWAAPILPARVVRAPHGREWLTLVALWKAEPVGARLVRRRSRPHRSGAVRSARARSGARLSLGLRRAAVRRRRASRQRRLVSHAAAQLDARSRLGDHRRGRRRHGAATSSGRSVAPAIAWLRRQPMETTVVLGGRHLGAGVSPVDRHAATASPVETFAAPHGLFRPRCSRFRPARSTAGPAYVPLEVTSVGGRSSLEQFDAQPPGVPMFAYRPRLAGAGVQRRETARVAMDEREVGSLGAAGRPRR